MTRALDPTGLDPIDPRTVDLPPVTEEEIACALRDFSLGAEQLHVDDQRLVRQAMAAAHARRERDRRAIRSATPP